MATQPLLAEGESLELNVIRPASGKWRIATFVVSTGWLMPVIFVLVLNFQGHIVGASFSCAISKDCVFEYDEDPEHAQERLLMVDRNVAGALQVVAKVLELWFLSIACSLIFNLMAGFARPGGVPLQYLFLHETLPNPETFLRRPFWTAPLQLRSRSRMGLYAFLVLGAVLSATVNLMGPAAAVLLLPVQRRATIGSLMPRLFVRARSSEPPVFERYEGFENFVWQASPPYFFSRGDLASRLLGLYIRAPLVFLQDLAQASRDAPNIMPLHYSDHEDLIDNSGFVTRCVRVGSGWEGNRNSYARFYVVQDSTNASATDYVYVSANIHSVTGSIHLNASTRHCGLPDVHDPRNCDWDAMFLEPLKPRLARFSLAQQVVDYHYPLQSVIDGTDASTYGAGSYNASWCHSFASLGFANYKTRAYLGGSRADTTNLVDTEFGDLIYIHPGWILAAWDVQENGTLAENTASRALESTLYSGMGNAELLVSDLNYQHFVIMSSALTLITYDEIPAADPATLAQAAVGTNVLDATVTAIVKQYGLQSRTSVLGCVVAIVGCAVAIANAALSLRRYYYESVGSPSLFAKALAYSPPPAKLDGETESQWLSRLRLKTKGAASTKVDGMRKPSSVNVAQTSSMPYRLMGDTATW
ncbi:hypothetical protein B0H67DRAFT_650892 [Lasiosphaeris hirsuta]|uniref:Uncharacterized protein n=1 Tax=Lasiosphaeris hirsuta TaxID=260670 RepID=A0AA40B8T5_9PEZI|nr:hypothetical protein B0H67DRAFT_650892 [Lasiosphaeris hirsuta]